MTDQLADVVVAQCAGLMLSVVFTWAAWFLVTCRIAKRMVVVLKQRLAASPDVTLQSLKQGEDGASYVLPLVMTIPIYLFFCLFVGEVTLLASTKIGVTYAAFAGARSLAVWHEQQPGLATDRLRQSVVHALAPFAASGHGLSGPAGEPQWPIEQHLDDYLTAIKQYSQQDVAMQNLENHYRKVAARTSLQTAVPIQERGADVTVTVTYRAPFLFAFVARWLDPDGRYPFELPIVSTVTLTLERPISENGKLGIDYVSY